MCKEVLPGDTFRVNTELFIRLAPMVSPLMQRIQVYTHFFFVPYRLLWEHWEDFITQSVQGYSSQPVPKQLPTATLHDVSSDDSNYYKYFKSGSLSDYLGLNISQLDVGVKPVAPIVEGKNWTFQYLPHLAYQKIWNDFYRDENLQEPDFIPAQDGNYVIDEDNTPIPDFELQLWNLRYRSWKKDYFTSALPWTQKGPDITLPLGGTVPVRGTSINGIAGQTEASTFRADLSGLAITSGGPTTEETRQAYFSIDPVSNMRLLYDGEDLTKKQAYTYQETDKLINLPPLNVALTSAVADLSCATPTTINELRRAFALQRWEELNARGGTRYVEQLAAHFGVRPRDSRLQRAEYLGGGVSDVQISEVLQTSETATTPQGHMSGHGVSASFNHAFKRYFEEHGVVLGIMSIMPKANYYQGVDRMFLKRGVYDFGWPSLAHLGEQPIYQEELFANDGIPLNVETDSPVFGYTPRYAEYKFSNDQIHGDFRTSLSNWHAGRSFANLPMLNWQFISGANFKPAVFSVDDVDPFWCQIYNDIKVSRKLPKFGTPSII
ncbi:major capsid protein [Dipodfec virus UA06Rod_19]|uniref:Major capsid protein n=1 Tax=Dipodfec virus UA06Rod_19 TaxID=2929319 RepID=A0A976N1M4_9VIRU|nr:major capsid protein [Dipodfec virus UA06Rod_19]